MHGENVEKLTYVVLHVFVLVLFVPLVRVVILQKNPPNLYTRISIEGAKMNILVSTETEKLSSR